MFLKLVQFTKIIFNQILSAENHVRLFKNIKIAVPEHKIIAICKYSLRMGKSQSILQRNLKQV